MTALPTWSSDLICETRCEVCQRPRFLTLPDILQAQPARCACGLRYVPVTPPGLPEIAGLLAHLDAAVRRGAPLSAPTRAPKGS